MSIGIALAGGGMQGVAHIGAIKALEELGIKPDYISGTSSGSLFASTYAMGYTLDEMFEIVKQNHEILVGVEKARIVKAIGTYITQKEIKIGGLIDGQKLEDIVVKLGEKKGIKNISDIQMPLAIPTVDTISAKECISISKKYEIYNDDIEYIYDIPIAKAVRASMAFPGIYTTCDFGKYNFIDGGTKDNLPVKVLKDMGADKVIAISFDLSHYIPSNNIFNIILRAVDIFSLKDVRAAQKLADVSIEIRNDNTSLLQTDNLEKCMQIGYETIMKNKDEIEKAIQIKC